MPKGISPIGGQREDNKKFDQKADCMVKQFDAYVPVENVHINGKLTVGRKSRRPRWPMDRLPGMDAGCGEGSH